MMNIPKFENLTEKEIGYFIGFFIGDGYCYHSKNDRHYMVELYFNSQSDNEISKKLCNILSKLSLKHFRIVDKRSNSFRIKTNSKKLMKFIEISVKNFRKSNENSILFHLLFNEKTLLCQLGQFLLQRHTATNIGVSAAKFAG